MSVGRPFNVGVVVPVYRQGNGIFRCIESVIESELPIGATLSLVLVDNSPGNSMLDNQSSPLVTVLRPGRNLGISGGRNAGMRAVPNADFVVFVDEDVAVDRNCIFELCEFLQSNPSAGVATPCITYGADPERIWAAGTNIDMRSGRVSFVADLSDLEPFRVGVAPSVIATSRAALDATGGFDPDFFAVYEDTDFCIRVASARMQTYCVPRARAVHDTPIEPIEQTRHLASRSYWIGRNRVLFMRRHGTQLARFALFWPIYAIYYGYVGLVAGKPLSFLQFLRGSVAGLFVPPRRWSLLRRPEWAVVATATAFILIWFHNGVLFGGGDQGPSFLRPDVAFRWSWQLWSDVAVGSTHPELVAAWPFWGTIDIFWRFGIPPWVLEAGVYWVCMVVGGISVMSLARRHCGKGSSGPLAAGFIYLLAPFTTINVWHRFLLTYEVFFALLPLSVAILHHYYGTGRYRYLALLMVVVPWFAIAFVSPGLVVIFGVSVIGDALYTAWTIGPRPVVRRFPIAAGALLASNLFWIIPLGLQGPSALSGPGITTSDNYVNFVGSSISTDLGNTFRLLNGFYLHGGFAVGWPYQSSVFLALLFILPLLGFSALLLRPSRSTFYLTLLALFGVFLAKGAAAPGGSVLGFFMRTFQPAGVLRNAYEEGGFIYLLGLSLLVGVTISELFARWTSLRPRVGGAVAGSALLLLGAWPIVTGSVFSSPQFGTYKVAPPPQYGALTTVFAPLRSSDSLAIVAPVANEGITYLWKYGYRGVDPTDILDPRTISMLSGSSLSAEMLKELSRFPEGNSATVLARMVGARYVLVRTDINPTPDHLLTPLNVERLLRSSAVYQKIERSGPLVLYRLRGCVDPLMYSTRTVLLQNDTTWSALAHAVGRNCATVVTPSPHIPKNLVGNHALTPERPLPFTRLSSTAYSVILPADYSGWVVLNQAFNTGWSARVINKVPSCPLGIITCLAYGAENRPQLAGPFLSNSYANAWYVHTTKPVRLLVLYRPQSLVEIAALLSFILDIIFGTICGFALKRRRLTRS